MGTTAQRDTGRNGGTGELGRVELGARALPKGDAGIGRHYGGDRLERAGDGLASFLGWFSIGLGVAQVVSPGGVARLIGMDDDDRTRNVMRAFGAREIATGVGILSNERPAGWLWARVAGDLLDLAVLGKADLDDDTNRRRSVAATAAVLGVTALDVVAAQRLTKAEQRRREREFTGNPLAEEPRAAVERDAGIRTRRSITVYKPRQDVYDFWRNFENLPRFMRHLESVVVVDERRSRWTALAPAGRTVEWEAETITDRAGELIAWRSLPGADVFNTGTVEFRESPEGADATEVHVDLTYAPPGGKLASKIAMLFREEPGQQVFDDLRRFKQVMETGEVVVSDATYRRGPHPAQPPAELKGGTDR